MDRTIGSNGATGLAAGLHGRNRWRLSVLLVGILFAGGRRTVTTWWRGAGVSVDYQNYLSINSSWPRGPQTQERIDRDASVCADGPYDPIAQSAVGGDRRLADEAVRSESRRSRHAPQSDAWAVGPEVLVRPYLGDDLAGAASSLVGFPGVAAARHALCSSANDRLHPEATRMEICDQTRPGSRTRRVDHGAREATEERGVDQASTAVMPRSRFSSRVNVSAEGARASTDRTGSVSPSAAHRRGVGRPSSVRCMASWSSRHTRPSWQLTECACGLIRVVIVKEDHGWIAFFCTDPNASVVEIVEAFSDRASIEQDYHALQGSLGLRPTAGAQRLDQRGGLQSQSFTCIRSWNYGLGSAGASELYDRSDSPWDDERAPAVSRQSPQSLTPTHHAESIIERHGELATPAKNNPARRRTHKTGRIAPPSIRLSKASNDSSTSFLPMPIHPKPGAPSPFSALLSAAQRCSAVPIGAQRLRCVTIRFFLRKCRPSSR